MHLVSHNISPMNRNGSQVHGNIERLSDHINVMHVTSVSDCINVCNACDKCDCMFGRQRMVGKEITCSGLIPHVSRVAFSK